jgi:hypothetical protein
MANTVVPVWGPCRLHSPSRKYERLPMTMMLSAWANVKPKVIRMAP